MKKTFYPDSFIVPLLFLSELAVFVTVCLMFASNPIIIISLLPLLICPILLIYCFRVEVDLEIQEIRRIKTRVPLASAVFVEARMKHGKGWNIQDKNSEKRILLPIAFYKHKTIEKIKNIIEHKALV